MDDSSKKCIINNKNELLNKLLINSTIIRSFSFPVEDAGVLFEFEEIVRREAGDRGFSHVLQKIIKKYVKAHRHGNPQLKLTPYVDEKAHGPARVLCAYLDGALSDGKIHCRKRGLWIKALSCYSCKHNRLKKTRKKTT